MSKHVNGRVLIFAAAFFAVPAHAVDDVPIGKDLTAVIALQGLPCGQVVSARRQGDNDYLAYCGDGHRYHVFVDSTGRVVAQKQ